MMIQISLSTAVGSNQMSLSQRFRSNDNETVREFPVSLSSVEETVAEWSSQRRLHSQVEYNCGNKSLHNACRGLIVGYKPLLRFHSFLPTKQGLQESNVVLGSLVSDRHNRKMILWREADVPDVGENLGSKEDDLDSGGNEWRRRSMTAKNDDGVVEDSLNETPLTHYQTWYTQSPWSLQVSRSSNETWTLDVVGQEEVHWLPHWLLPETLPHSTSQRKTVSSLLLRSSETQGTLRTSFLKDSCVPRIDNWLQERQCLLNDLLQRKWLLTKMMTFVLETYKSKIVKNNNVRMCGSINESHLRN
jgi:hypothetical protein